ncbi:4Fe-4S dicluster domain-containing protein [Salinisphaera aquimarina]|uniref:4Fe-4S dicluster domain-containing protein n=1 Tax=Salinisphaera aquimarina TaxID=2094031 RepID=A0ABV7ESD6_9GAMM
MQQATESEPTLPRWAKVIDQTSCIGCHACTTACKSENDVPVGVSRTYVKSADVGEFPDARRAFQVTRCNQCEDSPCTTACPTGAMHKRPDGIVDFNKDICIGCKACIAACPYDAIFINPEDNSAEKCNFCAHRIDSGLEPACVTVCPTQSIFVGDLNDPDSRVTQAVSRDVVMVRKPEKQTRPKLFYKGAHQATLDPLAATRPAGGNFAWAQQARDSDIVPSGHPTRGTSSAAAKLSYDQAHRSPWDWRVSAYTWTKNVGSGIYLITLMLVATGLMDAGNPLWRWVAPVGGGFFVALTCLLLVADLSHPFRFWMIFWRPQWDSWLVKGGVILVAYSALLAGHFASSIYGATWISVWLMWPGVVLAILSSIYTAFLFGQAKARDLWQNPLLAPHLLVQSIAAGAAIVVPFAMGFAPDAVQVLLWWTGGATLVHLGFVAAEVASPAPTAHSELALHEMTKGRFKQFFVAGVLLSVIGLSAPWLGVTACLFAFLGPLAYEHAFVQGGQSVPLA